MAQLTAYELSQWLVQSYRLVWAAVVLALLAELVCFRRVRRWNWWLTLLTGVTVCLQTVVVLMWLTFSSNTASLFKAILEVNLLGFSGAAAVGAWLAARRVWCERARSAAPMAWLRAAAIALMTVTFLYQVRWGAQLIEIFSMFGSR